MGGRLPVSRSDRRPGAVDERNRQAALTPAALVLVDVLALVLALVLA